MPKTLNQLLKAYGFDPKKATQSEINQFVRQQTNKFYQLSKEEQCSSGAQLLLSDVNQMFELFKKERGPSDTVTLEEEEKERQLNEERRRWYRESAAEYGDAQHRGTFPPDIADPLNNANAESGSCHHEAEEDNAVLGTGEGQDAHCETRSQASDPSDPEECVVCCFCQTLDTSVPRKMMEMKKKMMMMNSTKTTGDFLRDGSRKRVKSVLKLHYMLLRNPIVPEDIYYQHRNNSALRLTPPQLIERAHRAGIVYGAAQHGGFLYIVFHFGDKEVLYKCPPRSGSPTDELVLRPFVIFVLVFIITFGSYANFYMFYLMSGRVLLAGLLLPWCGFMFGCFVSLLMRQDPRDVSAIAIETGIQNTGVAIMLLKVSFGQPDADLASVLPVVCSIFTPVPLLTAWAIHKWAEKVYGKKQHLGPEAAALPSKEEEAAEEMEALQQQKVGSPMLANGHVGAV